MRSMKCALETTGPIPVDYFYDILGKTAGVFVEISPFLLFSEEETLLTSPRSVLATVRIPLSAKVGRVLIISSAGAEPQYNSFVKT